MLAAGWLPQNLLVFVGVKVADFCQVTDSTYTREEVLEMERILLDTLSWELTQPTIMSFLRRFVKAATFHLDPALSKRYPKRFLARHYYRVCWVALLLCGLSCVGVMGVKFMAHKAQGIQTVFLQ